MRRVLSAMVVGLLLAGPAQAQGPLVKYGKWAVLAGSVGMNYLALRAHNRADDAFNNLKVLCVDRSRCNLAPDGSYLDPASENLYQTSLRYDRIARGWLFGGEAALAGSAALFVWELTRPKGRPGNIPFEPEVRSLRWGTGLGLRVSF
jgi:hypothetical protein